MTIRTTACVLAVVLIAAACGAQPVAEVKQRKLPLAPAEHHPEGLDIVYGAIPTTTTTTQPTRPRPAPIGPGEDRWDRLAWCESRGNWQANTGNGYYGGLQFLHLTWLGWGGDEFAYYPHEASREQQIIVAERLFAKRGWAPWPGCTRSFGWR